MRIGLVAGGYPPDPGGVEVHCAELARMLVARGHRVAVLALDARGGPRPYSTTDTRIEGVHLRLLSYRYHDHERLVDLVRNARAEEIVETWIASHDLSLVHVHHMTGFGVGTLSAVARTRRPALVSLHDYWTVCPRGQMWHVEGTCCEDVDPERCGPCSAATWPHLAPRSLDVRENLEYARDCLARFATRILTPSAAARDVLVRCGVPAERLSVCPNGVDVAGIAQRTQEARAALARKGDPRSRRPRLGILGAVQPSKGVLELARALASTDLALNLEVHGPLVAYHGDTSYVDALRDLAASEPRVVLFGPYAYADLPRVLARLDGVAVPSRWNEAFGLSAREARAAGLPVWVADRGGLIEGGDEGVHVVRGSFDACLRACAEGPRLVAPRVASPVTPWGVRSLEEMVVQLEAEYQAALSPPRTVRRQAETRRSAKGAQE